VLQLLSSSNVRYERMHLTLKKETAKPAGMNDLQQRARFDALVAEFNTEIRPKRHLGLFFERADFGVVQHNP
jgi:hypothetical protein